MSASAQSPFVLVHGAFRGGWSWDRVRAILEWAGHPVHTPTLDPVATSLAVWTAAIVDLLETADLRDAVLVGHSLGGVVVREAALRAPERLRRLVYLDAAVPDPGERAVDLGAAPPVLPHRDTVVPPRPLAPEGDLDPRTAAWINERLTPLAIAPSLDAATRFTPAVPATYLFCTGTPSAYPCGTTRSRLDERGIPYRWIEAGHDAPLTRPEAVAEQLLAAAVPVADDRSDHT